MLLINRFELSFTMETITLTEVRNAYESLKCHPDLFHITPTVECTQQLKHLLPDIKSVHVKLESMQCTGSFKARGVVHQFLTLSEDDRKKLLVTMSAGNYGKTFAYVASKKKLQGVVFMPDTAPINRKQVIQSYGSEVIRCPTQDLMQHVNSHQVLHDSLFLHSFDDPNLIIGYASAALELNEQVSSPADIVIVCCGGGGFLAGVALGLRLAGWTHTRIIGVEPESAPTMYDAMKEGNIVNTAINKTIASGLAPPFAGKHAYQVVKKHVNEIILVSDSDLKFAMKELYSIGLVSEPSGAAAMAALFACKIADTKDKSITVFITGGNVTVDELKQHLTNVNLM